MLKEILFLQAGKQNNFIYCKYHSETGVYCGKRYSKAAKYFINI